MTKAARARYTLEFKAEASVWLRAGSGRRRLLGTWGCRSRRYTIG
jgi:hypothetical protein